MQKSSSPPIRAPPLPPRRCFSCLAVSMAVLAGIIASFLYLDLPLGSLFSAQAGREMADFFVSFFPPDLSPDFLAKVGKGTLETIAISAIGTLLAALGGLGLSIAAAGRLGRPLQVSTRFFLNALRSVPELVWATLMVLAAGLGPFAGVMALALHTTGVLGRLFAEALENAPDTPRQALAESGARPLPAFFYGTWPLILPQVVAYTLYRWEMNVRMAAILGFVGAGGLGALLYYELSLFHQAQAATVILAMLAITLAVDSLSGQVRAGLSQR